MQKLSTSESVKRCAWLLIAPWRLPGTAVEVSVGPAICFGALALGWYVAGYTFCTGVIVSEPFAQWAVVWRNVFELFAPCGMLPFFVVGGCAAGFFWMGQDKGRFAYQTRVLALSFVPLILPFSGWSVMCTLVSVSPEVMQQPEWVSNTLASGPATFFGSYMWMSVLCIAWLPLLCWAFVGARRLAIERGVLCVCDCGYDLRGSIAGAAERCPECGLVIPASVKANAPSIHENE